MSQKMFWNKEETRGLLHTIIGRIGEDAVIEPPFNFLYGCNISLGDKFYANVKS